VRKGVVTVSDITAEIAALLRAIQRADDACWDAEYLSADEDPDLETFRAAVRRLRKLEADLAALWCRAAGGSFVHAENHWRH
jgi:hypothetical protein